jgi:hypothetical protein
MDGSSLPRSGYIPKPRVAQRTLGGRTDLPALTPKALDKRSTVDVAIVTALSPSVPVDDRKRYIAEQAGRYRRETFHDEFRRLCDKYGLQLDERYAWD